ncbi:hypothetical protein V6N13_144906 [Hibiscus sabdariffa]|uniref:Uncharacterized protein n=1 Tax=Hibiscus sabdariffa TaxID=183260 RepID=A0ABR2FLU2_9ROSI
MVIGSGNNSPLLQGRKWLKMAITGIIMLASVTSEHEIGTPSAELLCISDCAACPVICSPPPPPLLKSFSPPPSSVHLPPLEPYYTPRSPSESDDTHTHCPPPLEPESLPSPVRPPPPAPPSYSSKASPPPPRFVYFTGAPPGEGQGLPTGGVGPQEYPYPYYYYPSKASSLSFKASLLLGNVVLFQCCVIALLKSFE